MSLSILVFGRSWYDRHRRTERSPVIIWLNRDITGGMG